MVSTPTPIDVEVFANCLRRRLSPSPVEDFDAAINVVIGFCPDPRAVMLERSRNPRDPWAGDMAFPGGRRENGESVLETALRETREEVCINNGELTVLGFLDPVSPRNVPLNVVPVVTLYRGGCPRKILECRSVEAVRTALVPLPARLSRREVLHPVRGFRVNAYVDWFGNVVWGMSYRVLARLYPALTECLAVSGWPIPY